MMITTVSLPKIEAQIWRKSQREVMRLAVRILRITMFKISVRRGVKRHYNWRRGEFEIVMTRFTEAEYDMLHCAAAAMRVSVSWIIWCMIKLWKKPARRARGNPHINNYFCDVPKWNQLVGVVTESLYFWSKKDLHHPAHAPPVLG